MKTYIKLLTGIALMAVVACNNEKVVPGTYVDLNSGDSIRVEADPESGYAINSETQKPVYLYVNEKEDTIFTTGVVVNNKLVKTTDGYWEVDEQKVKVEKDGDVVIKYGDYKKKVDGDDYKIKDGDYKLKVEGDGDMKLKDGDYKRKVDEDGDVKIKDGDTKIKVEDGVETKRKN